MGLLGPWSRVAHLSLSGRWKTEPRREKTCGVLRPSCRLLDADSGWKGTATHFLAFGALGTSVNTRAATP